MPLYFTDKKKRWPPPKPVQYVLAVCAVLLAGVILVLWLRSMGNDAPSVPNATPDITTTQTQIDLPDAGYCLVIIEDAEYERFALVEFAPIHGTITVQPLAPDLPLNESETLVQLYRRAKAAQLTETLAAHYRLPLQHFVSLSISELQALISRWDVTLTMTLPEEITYRDENNALVRLPAEENALALEHIGALLHHTQWQSEEADLQLTANLTIALLNHLLVPNRNPESLYKDIANHTSVRVQHFQAFSTGLAHLASLNDGSLAKEGTISIS